MKLLMVCANFPSPTWGAGTRNYYLLKSLASRNTVSLLVSVDNAELETVQDVPPLEKLACSIHVVTSPTSRSKRFQQFMNLVRGRSHSLSSYDSMEMQKTVDTLLAQDRYDAVLFESALIAGCRVPHGVEVIIDQHNIEHELLERTYRHEKAGLRKWYSWLESRLLKGQELERCARAAQVLVTSERERVLLKSMLPESVIEVVPNGVDIDAFQAISSRQEVAGRITFIGTMHYYPNVDAVLSFAQKCWPLIRAKVPDATWQIVGHDPLPEVQRLARLRGVTVTGPVPDVRSYLAASEVVIAPLQVGSGTRLKILEALAMQKAVVTTSLGCEGLSVESGEHLIVADQPGAFAQAVIALLHNPEMRVTYGTAGRKLVEAEYSWERCGTKMLHVLEELEGRMLIW